VVLERVKPEREQNNRASYRDLWWVFGEPRRELRPALAGLDRYIVTVETAKHRVFTFREPRVLPDNKLIVFAVRDADRLGVLSSHAHVTWALSSRTRLGFGDDPVYAKSLCFDPFPFPDCGESQRETIAAIAEELDGLRKERLRLHPEMTLTGLYNVLAKLRSGEDLTATERNIHDRGLVRVLQQLHDDLDHAVFAAYGWPADLGDDDLLARLVALNRERAEEEWRGTVRWLRPEFQTGIIVAPVQRELTVAAAGADARTSWPRELPDQFKAVRAALTADSAPASVDRVAGNFVRARVAEVLQTLVSLGQARETAPGRYTA
jgi:hypothetical protein